MKTICALRPNVSRDQASKMLAPGGLDGLLRSVRQGTLRSVADLYIPFRLYRVRIDNAGRTETKLLALECVRGSFDLYSLDEVPGAHNTIQVATRNFVPAELVETKGLEIVREQVRRVVFGAGFFRVRDLKIEVEPAGTDFHVPYWVGFFGNEENLALIVIDAVRRRFEGTKVRQFVKEWLSAGHLSIG
jgi:hypothetical protein